MRAGPFLIALAGALVTGLSHAPAAEKPLTSDEIAATITGNTIFGVYDGDPYAQYFDPNGTSIFQFKGGDSYEGDWHVDDAADRYCSYHWYRGSKCYDIFRDGNQLFWIEEGTADRLPSTLVQGRQLYESVPLPRSTRSK